MKSLLGEKLSDCWVDARGASGDRAYAVSGLDGKLGSGKDSRRFKRIDGLLSLSAESTDDGVSVTFPDGTTLSNDNPLIDGKLSQVLGQRVTLTKEAGIPHFDDSPVHILTTESLSLLNDLLPNSGVDLRRFRPNIVIDNHYPEQSIVGKVIKVGGTTLEITHRTERCRMITIAQQDLEDSPEILKAVSKNFGLDFGVYARVLSTGSLSVGDSVEVIES